MISFSTHGIAAPDRATSWNEAIADTYFPLSLQFAKSLDFNGRLSKTSVGSTHLSRLESDAVLYERRAGHIRHAQKEDYLITMPRKSSVSFRQLGREVSCEPGGFIIQRGDEPYRFSYHRPNDLYVLKVDKSDLAERIRQPDQYCAQIFDGTKGVGALFLTMTQQIQSQANQLAGASAEVLSRQLLELLALTIKSEPRSAASTTSSVRAAHLLRIEKFIHENITNPDLSPDLIAQACGISKRYLHDLFKDVNGTVAQQVRDQRLTEARRFLKERPGLAISEIAYRFGFADQAQFSRLFKTKFKLTPSEFRRH